MPLFLLALGPVAKELWSLRYLVLSIALVGLFWWYSVHERNIGAAACKAEVEQATANEHQRRQDVEKELAVWAADDIGHVKQLETKNADLDRLSKNLSAANDRKICLDPAAVGRLNRVQH